MKQKKKGAQKEHSLLDTIGYMGDAGGAGLLKGGAITADMLYSLLSSPLRDRKEGRGLLSHVFGESPIMSKINAYEEASKKRFGPMPFPARVVSSIAENVIPTIAGEKAVGLAKKYGPGALELISKITPDFVLKGGSEAGKILNKFTPSFVKNMFKGSDINNKGVMVSSGIGAQAGEEVAEHFGEGLGPIGRFAGGILGPYGAARFSNRFIFTPTASIPLNIDPTKQEILKSISGNKRFSGPMLDFAKRSEASEMKKIAAAEKAAAKTEAAARKAEQKAISKAEKNAEAVKLKNQTHITKTYNEVRDILKSLNHQYNVAGKSNPLSSERIDTTELIDKLSKNRNKYEVSPLEVHPLEKPKSSKRTEWLDKKIEEARVTNSINLEQIKRDVGAEMRDYGGGKEVYEIFKGFLEKKVPNYKAFSDANDIGRQIEILYKDFRKSAIGKKGDHAKALEKFANTVQTKIENKDLDINRLFEKKVPGAQQIQNALDKKITLLDVPDVPKASTKPLTKTEIPEFNPVISQDEVLRNIGKREAAAGQDFSELAKRFGTSAKGILLSFATPSKLQRDFQSLIPGHFVNPYTSALEGAALSAVNSGYFPALAQTSTPTTQNAPTQTAMPVEQNAPMPGAGIQEKSPDSKQDIDPFDAIVMEYLGNKNSPSMDGPAAQQQKQDAVDNKGDEFDQIVQEYLGRR